MGRVCKGISKGGGYHGDITGKYDVLTACHFALCITYVDTISLCDSEGPLIISRHLLAPKFQCTVLGAKCTDCSAHEISISMSPRTSCDFAALPISLMRVRIVKATLDRHPRGARVEICLLGIIYRACIIVGKCRPQGFRTGSRSSRRPEIHEMTFPQ